MIGSLLPWLTFFAGLQRYGGTIGIYGRLIFGAGTLAVAAGIAELRVRLPWLRWTTEVVGGVLCAFTLWLLVGLRQIVSDPSTVMLVPAPGPGLFVILAGGAILAIVPALDSRGATTSTGKRSVSAELGASAVLERRARRRPLR
jgi:hypothetical protein